MNEEAVKRIALHADGIILGLSRYPKIAPLIKDIRICYQPESMMEAFLSNNAKLCVVGHDNRIIINPQHTNVDDIPFLLLHAMYNLMYPMDYSKIHTPADSRAFVREPSQVEAANFALIGMNKLGLVGQVDHAKLWYARDLMEAQYPDMLQLFDGVVLA